MIELKINSKPFLAWWGGGGVGGGGGGGWGWVGGGPGTGHEGYHFIYTHP